MPRNPIFPNRKKMIYCSGSSATPNKILKKKNYDNEEEEELEFRNTGKMIKRMF